MVFFFSYLFSLQRFFQKKPVSRIVFALAKKNESAAKALRNIKQVKTLPFSNLNALNVVNTQFLVIDEDALEVVKETKKVKSKSEAKIKTKKEDKQIKTKKVK